MCDYPDPTAPIAGLAPLRRAKPVSIRTWMGLAILVALVAISLL
jgi:hypothetical protein